MVGVAVAARKLDTVIDFLGEAERVISQAQTRPLDKLREALLEISSGLVRICQEDFISIRGKVLAKGKEWSGEQTVNSYIHPDTESFDQGKESILIREESVKLISSSTRIVGETREDDEAWCELSKDGEWVQSVFYQTTKTFGSGPDAVKIVIWRAMVRLRNNVIFRVAVLSNIDKASFETGSFHYRPQEATIYHECVLPEEST